MRDRRPRTPVSRWRCLVVARPRELSRRVAGAYGLVFGFGAFAILAIQQYRTRRARAGAPPPNVPRAVEMSVAGRGTAPPLASAARSSPLAGRSKGPSSYAQFDDSQDGERDGEAGRDVEIAAVRGQVV